MAPIIKEEWEIKIMREAGRIAAEAIELMKRLTNPGVTTGYIDKEVENFILSKGAKPTFKGYRGFPASICASVNNEVVHGIPNGRALKDGDIVSLDVGATYKNYVGDTAVTLAVGKISPKAEHLIDVTKKALDIAIEKMSPGVKLTDVSRTIQDYAQSNGFSVVKKYVGHGIGTAMHEDPQVPNYVPDDVGRYEVILKPGLVLAIEPMVNEGADDVKVLKNNWTVVTKDGMLSAHFEHTVAVTKNGREVLTLL